MKLTTFDIRDQAESALLAVEQAYEVLSLWLNSLPGSREYESESWRVAAVMSLLENGLKHLKEAVENDA
jgi:hypothetical protein